MALLLAVALAFGVPPSAAAAVSVGINLGFPAIVAPPVVVAPPAPVYAAPPPVVYGSPYGPPPVVVTGGYWWVDRYGHRHWRRR